MNRRERRMQKPDYRGLVKGAEPRRKLYSRADDRNRYVRFLKEDGRVVTVRRLRILDPLCKITGTTWHPPLVRKVSQRGEVHYG